MKPYFETKHGKAFHQDSLEGMDAMADGSVDLIMTSPPYALNSKKDYGNADSDKYLDWFRPFAERFHRVMNDKGSLVINIGGAWTKGMPTRTLVHFKLMIMLVEEYGFHLCQEHYWHNPSLIPGPAIYTNIRRIRAKDACEICWWLSKTPDPKADNKNVLLPYSNNMQRIIDKGDINIQKHPSGHTVGKSFTNDNGGSIPPNILIASNTRSNTRYFSYCRENNLALSSREIPTTSSRILHTVSYRRE